MVASVDAREAQAQPPSIDTGAYGVQPPSASAEGAQVLEPSPATGAKEPMPPPSSAPVADESGVQAHVSSLVANESQALALALAGRFPTAVVEERREPALHRMAEGTRQPRR